MGSVVRALAAHLPVIVVDDGSRDETARVASVAGARVISHATNLGKGAALLTGLAAAREAGFTHLVSVDADGQHSADDLPALLDASRAQPEAIVVGARDFEVPNVPGSSRFGRRFSNLWVRLETGEDLSDTQSGYRIYPVEATLGLEVPASRFEWEVCVLVFAAWAGVPLVDVPIGVFYPPPDQRVSHYRGFVDSARISWLHTRLVTRGLLRPIRRLARAHSSAPRLAAAVALGVFVGSSPFYGLHAVIGLALGKLLRLNLLAVVAGTNISVPFVAPFLVFGSVQSGHRLLYGEWLSLDVASLSLEVARRTFGAWLLGSALVGAALGVFAGGLTYAIVRKIREKRVESAP